MTFKKIRIASAADMSYMFSVTNVCGSAYQVNKNSLFTNTTFDKFLCSKDLLMLPITMLLEIIEFGKGF